MANSAAILTDAFPAEQRGFALGTNQIAALAGQFIGLVAGGLLAAIDWRAVFWINVPVGVVGTLWAYRQLRDTGERHRGAHRLVGQHHLRARPLRASSSPITYGIQPYGGHAMGWTNPLVLGRLVGGVLLLLAFVLVESRVADPMFRAAALPDPRLRGGQRRRPARGGRARRPAVHAHHLAAGHLAAAARLRLRGDPAVGRHLPAAADRRLPRRRPDRRAACPTGSARAVSPPRAC